MDFDHARRRALQRFGIYLTEEQLCMLEALIGSTDAQSVPGLRFAGRAASGASLWEVVLQGKKLIAVYRCKMGKRPAKIKTFLTPKQADLDV